MLEHSFEYLTSPRLIGTASVMLTGLVAMALTASRARRSEERERVRLRNIVFPSEARFYTSPDGGSLPIMGQRRGDVLVSPRESKDGDNEQGQEGEDECWRPPESSSDFDRMPSHPPAEGESNGRFIELLIEYYAHGLTQARRNSLASLISAGVGIATVIVGAVSALFAAQSGRGVTAAVVVSLSGAITNAIGVLFHRQANRSLEHMESQTQNLRVDMRTDRETRKATDLIESVSDPNLRDRLRSAVILQLAQANLPMTHSAVDFSTNDDSGKTYC